MTPDADAGAQARCVECGETVLSPLVCTACATLRPPKSEFNHFVRLGLPVQYKIEPRDLERRFLVLARGLHPDQFAMRPPEERELAEQLSAQLNDSYKVVRDPLLRAEYLLELLGGSNRDQDKSTPKAFLMEMLELNEEIESASEDSSEEARATLVRLRDDLCSRLEEIIKTFEPSFSALDQADASRRISLLLQIREKLNMCSYLQGLLQQTGELLLR